MTDAIVIAILALLLGVAIFYLYREKKRGAKCIGCPYSKECGGKCGEDKKDK